MRPISLRTVAVPDALNEIERTLANVWSAHPHLPEAICMRIGIAVTEIAANIIEHATKGLDRHVHMQMKASVRKKNIVITLVDDGIPAPALDFTTMPGELAESGRGLALARTVLSRLDYRRYRELNYWTLVSDSFPAGLAPASAPQSAFAE